MQLLDLAYSRYGGGASDVLAMPFEEGLELLTYAIEQRTEDKAWERWIHSMSDMSFSEYKEKIGLNKKTTTQEVEPKQSIEEVLSFTKEIFG